tara:strand:+ start:308 stop:583 length:276 start_codon:yes stop_codon:yes gene_type:complete
MCVPLAGMAASVGLMEQLGDPLGTKKRRDDAAAEDQKNKWAREDQIRDATFAHEQQLADKGAYGGWKGGKTGGKSTGNRSSLKAQSRAGGM